MHFIRSLDKKRSVGKRPICFAFLTAYKIFPLAQFKPIKQLYFPVRRWTVNLIKVGWKSDIIRFNEFLAWLLEHKFSFKVADFTFATIYRSLNNLTDFKGISGGVQGSITQGYYG